MQLRTTLDVNFNQLLSPVIHNSSIPPPGEDGQLYFNTVTNLLYLYHTGNWHEFALGPIVLSLNALNDVTITSPQDNDILQYNNITSQWENVTITAAGIEPTITPGLVTQYWAGDKTWQTLNTDAVVEATNLYFTDARARQSISVTTIGTTGPSSYSNITGVLNIPQYQGQLSLTTTGTGGLSTLIGDTLNIPQYQNQISLTTTGSSGASTFISNVLNVPNYTLSGLGGIGGSGTVNRIPKFTPNSTTLGDSNLQDDGTLVSILNSRLFLPGQATTVGEPTGSTGGLYYNTTNNGLRIFNGTNYSFLPESATPRFTSTYVLHGGSDNRITENVNFTWQPGRLFLGWTGGSSVFINSGGANNTGSTNTGVGFNSFVAITSGNQNSGFGAETLRALTTGLQNSALGWQALRFLTTGSRNTAIGFRALGSITTQSNNVAIGWDAGRGNTLTQSVFVGYRSGGTSNGTRNTIIGPHAWRLAGSSVTADDLVIIGFGAGELNQVSQSTFIGSRAGRRNTTGEKNIALGYNSLISNTTGSRNISIGSNTLVSSRTLNDNIAIGDDAFRETPFSDTLTITSGDVVNQTFTTSVPHGFPVGDTRTGRFSLSPGLGLNSTAIYQFEVIDSVTLLILNGSFSNTAGLPVNLNIFSQLQNSIAIGSSSTPDKNNQIRLGNTFTEELWVGNYRFDIDETVNAGKDNNVLSYNHTSGLISLAPIITNWPNDRIAYVSDANGDDATAELGNPMLPYQTIDQAYDDLDNASDGLIYVLDGSHFVFTTTDNPNITIHGLKDVDVTLTDVGSINITGELTSTVISSASTGFEVVNVTGNGILSYLNSSATATGLLNVQGLNSVSITNTASTNQIFNIQANDVTYGGGGGTYELNVDAIKFNGVASQTGTGIKKVRVNCVESLYSVNLYTATAASNYDIIINTTHQNNVPIVFGAAGGNPKLNNSRIIFNAKHTTHSGSILYFEAGSSSSEFANNYIELNLGHYKTGLTLVESGYFEIGASNGGTSTVLINFTEFHYTGASANGAFGFSAANRVDVMVPYVQFSGRYISDSTAIYSLASGTLGSGVNFKDAYMEVKAASTPIFTIPTLNTGSNHPLRLENCVLKTNASAKVSITTPTTPIQGYYLDRDLDAYVWLEYKSSGNKTATSLSRTESNYVLGTATDGTVIQIDKTTLGGGGGEANTASNIGSGSGLFESKSGVDLRFKSLTSSSGITLTPSSTEVNISLGSVTANRVLVSDVSGNIVTDNELTYNSSGNTLTLASGNLELTNSDISQASTNATVTFTNSNATQNMTRASNNAFSPNINMNKARGTISAPAATNIGDSVGDIAFFNYNGSAYTRVGGIYTEIINDSPYEAVIGINGATDDIIRLYGSTEHVQLPAYGTGAINTTTLSKTQSVYLLSLATDGTIVERTVSSINDGNGLYTGSGLISGIVDADLDVGSSLSFNYSSGGGALTVDDFNDRVVINGPTVNGTTLILDDVSLKIRPRGTSSALFDESLRTSGSKRGFEYETSVPPDQTGLTMRPNRMTVLTEVSSNSSAELFKILPVNSSSTAITITPPSSPTTGDWFIVADSRGTASSNNITIDFPSSTFNYHGSSVSAVLNTNLDSVQFIYINSTVGWIKQ